MDYQTLQARVLQNFNNRSGLTTIIQNCIADIRNYVCGGKLSLSTGRRIEHRWSFCFDDSQTQATTQSDYDYNNPTGCIEMLSIAIGTTELKKRTFNQWQKVYQGDTSEDEPEIWVPRNGEYWVYPIPDGAYTLQLYFYGFLTALSDNDDEYALERDYPMVAVNGASWYVAQILREKDAIAMYKGMFEEDLLSALSSDIMAQRRGTRPRFKTWREDAFVDDTYSD